MRLHLLALCAALGLSGPAWSPPEAAAVEVGGGKARSKAPTAAWDPGSRAAVEAYNAAVDHLNGANPKAAERRVRRALAVDGEFGLGLLLLGQALVFQERFDEGIEVLARLAELHPDREEVWGALSDSWFVRQDFARARAVAERGLQRLPDSLVILESLTHALVRTGDYEAALRAFGAQRARQDRPGIACLEVLVEADRGDATRAAALLDTCRAATEPHLVQNAEARVDTLLEGAPKGSGEADLDLAFSLAEQDRLREAVQVLDRLLQRDPKQLSARILRAECRYRLRLPKQALDDLEQALDQEGWIQVSEAGAVSGVLTKRSEQELVAAARDGAALFVTLLGEEGRHDEAKEQLARAFEVFGPTPALRAAGAHNKLRAGEAGAWEDLAAVLAEHPADRAALDVAGSMVFDAGRDAPAAVLEAIRGATDFGPVFNATAGLANAARWPECADLALVLAGRLAAAPVGAESLAAAQAAGVAPMGHGCAVRAERWADAERLLELSGGAERLEQPAVVGHAAGLMEAGRPEDALALLDAGKALQRGDVRRAESLAIFLCADLGLWDRAVELAGRPKSDPAAGAYLGAKLAQAELFEQAEPVLSAACPRLRGDQARRCNHNLDLVRSR